MVTHGDLACWKCDAIWFKWELTEVMKLGEDVLKSQVGGMSEKMIIFLANGFWHILCSAICITVQHITVYAPSQYSLVLPCFGPADCSAQGPD